jgi:small GTP-binding protein
VGKSTLLNDLTNAESKIADYEFTTLEIIPGVMDYNGAKIQFFDIPGIITGASKGKGRGREILSVARNADLILIIMDIFNLQHFDIIVNELNNIGIRPNEQRADVTVKKKKIGGIKISSTVELTNIDHKTIRSVLNEYGIHSADVLIRDDVSVDQFIDSLDQSCKYIPTLKVVNKIDLADKKYLNQIKSEMKDAIFISADKEINVEKLKRKTFKKLELIRIYLKPQGKKVDYEEPLIIKKGSTVKDVAIKLHRDFVRNFRHAKVWGTSVKFKGQKVGLDHVLNDGDILRIIIKK